MNNEELKSACYAMIDLLNYVTEIQKLGNCNTCIFKECCVHAPKVGQMVRINCFDYVKEKDEVVK